MITTRIMTAGVNNDAAANQALVKFLAEQLSCPRNQVVILGGHKSRHKVLKLHGFTETQVFAAVLQQS